MKRSSIKNRIFALITAVLMLICLGAQAFADEQLFFFSDEADILSSEFEKDMQKRGIALFERTGCQISVVTVDFLGGKDIESFSEEIFLSEKIGEGDDRGLLLVFSTGEEHYHAILGQGMSGIISQAKLQKLLDKTVEPDFAEGNYAAAAENFYYEVIELLEEHFSISTDEGDFLLYKQQLEEERLKAEKERKYTFYAFAAVGAVTLLLFVRFVIILIVSLRRRARQKRRLF